MIRLQKDTYGRDFNLESGGSPVIGATDSTGTHNSSGPAPAEKLRDGVPPETVDSTEANKLNRLFRPVFNFRRKHPNIIQIS